MDDKSSFLEMPLDMELYHPKEFVKPPKPPIRVLLTDAGSKPAYNLIYYLCSGKVFGPDQEIILHLVNAKGSIHHKSVLMELEQCGFHLCVDTVVSSESKKAYKKVDIVLLLVPFTELPGHSLQGAVLNQLAKFGQVAKNVRLYGKPDTKLVVYGPSSKGIAFLLNFLRLFEPKIKSCYVSGVTIVDENKAKALLAARLKTTTDKIKNLVLWGTTIPDTYNATVLMHPPGDTGSLDPVEVPLEEAIDDQNWLCGEFVTEIYAADKSKDVIKYGKALALATVKHLRALFLGSEQFDEIISMSTVVPPHQPYGIDEDLGFSFPVTTKDGVLKITEGIRYGVTTHLMMIRCTHNLKHDPLIISARKMIPYLIAYQEKMSHSFLTSEHEKMMEKDVINYWHMKRLIIPINDDFKDFKKSVLWNDLVHSEKTFTNKSMLRFNLEFGNWNKINSFFY